MSSTTTIDGSSEALTRGVRVRVRAEYLPEQSDPGHGLWFYVYHVVVVNEGDEAAQLISRHWIITNAEGNEEQWRCHHQHICQPIFVAKSTAKHGTVGGNGIGSQR